MAQYRYQLDESSKKHTCPACNQKRFVRYVDNETGGYLPDDVGKCDRLDECAYHKAPREAGIKAPWRSSSKPQPQKPPEPDFIPFEHLERSQGKYQENTLIKWLGSLPGWDMQRAEAIAEKYYVGTSANNWAIFWQVDRAGKVRSGKMMKYQQNGHRVKNGYSQDWIHSKLKKSGRLDEFELVQCFFGLHLLDDRPVAIAEAEKTALIASQYLPQFVWMAAGALQGINESKMKALQGRKVFLFPDIGAFDLWSEKALELSHIAEIYVSDLLERNATNENAGDDIADFLIQHDLRDFSLM